MFGKRKSWEDTYDEAYSDRPERIAVEQPRAWIHLAFLAILPIVFLGAVWAVSGRQLAEKTLQNLFAPLGIVWLILFGMLYFYGVYRCGKSFLVTAGLFLLVTLGGNDYVKRALVDSLESEYLAMPPLEEPVDVLVVLGGATSTKMNGQPQVTFAGERIVTAARLFHNGKCKQIVLSGTDFRLVDERDRHPCEEAQSLLVSLGIPERAITMLKGSNTREEAESFRVWLDRQSFPQTPRIGLVTSTWHLKRAVSQFERNGVNVIPIAADSLSSPPKPSPSLLIPSAANLETVTLMLREYIGRWVGR